MCIRDRDIRDVAEHFRDLDIPCDAIHFDIDYMDGYRVFTWNDAKYGKPGDLIAEIKKQGFKTVTIIDPGTKVDPDYFMCKEGEENLSLIHICSETGNRKRLGIVQMDIVQYGF